MRLSFDKTMLLVKTMTLFVNSMRLAVDKKPLLQDKEALHPMNGRRSAMKKRQS
jgi:hypothetical protein